MHPQLVRNFYRQRLAETGAIAVELAALTGNPLSDEDRQLLETVHRTPSLSRKRHFRHYEKMHHVIADVLNVVRVMEAENPLSIQQARALVEAAREAEREAEDLEIGGGEVEPHDHDHGDAEADRDQAIDHDHGADHDKAEGETAA